MEKKKYTTTDLYLSAFLKTLGHPMQVAKKGNRASFIFNECEDLVAQVNLYLTDGAQCNPLAYSNNIKNIKNLLYNL